MRLREEELREAAMPAGVNAAAKYTRPRGRIVVEAHRDGNDVVVCVEDSGEGIPEELLPQVFDMFVRSPQTLARSQGGLGIGLAIVKSLVTMRGGRISARSEGPGRGSTFTSDGYRVRRWARGC